MDGLLAEPVGHDRHGGQADDQGHVADPGASANPLPRNSGSTPARSSEDLPAPDTPDTTTTEGAANRLDIRASNSVVALSRPQKNGASRSPNEFNPRYGNRLCRHR